MERKCRLKNN